MTEFVQLALLGMATGSLYALSALGINVVNRSSGVVNFANGAMAMTSGYLYWLISSEGGLPTWIAVIVAVLGSTVLSTLVYLLAIRPLSGASALARLVATLGVYIVLQGLVMLIFGPVNKIPVGFLPTQAVGVLGLSIGLDRVIIILGAIALTVILWVVYRFSRFGLATAAVAENPRALSALGFRVELVRAGSWSVAGLLSGLAGVLIAPITQLTPTVFIFFLVPALAAAIVGGMKSFPITLIAGMLLGAVQVLVLRYVPVPGMSDAVPFLLIIVVLVVFGRGVPSRSFSTERLPRAGTGRIYVVPIVLATLLAIVLAFTILTPNMVLGIAVLGSVAIIGLSQVVITGYAGQLSLAQMTMAGLGGLVAAQVSVLLGVPFIVAILIGAISVIPVSLLIGLPALRTRGTTLAVATLGFATAVNAVVLTNSQVNGGALGLQVGSQDVFGISLDTLFTPANYMIFVLLWLIAIGVLVANLRRGRSGRRLLALRSNERAAAALGVNVAAAKLFAFTLAGSIAAIGGALLMFRNPNVVPSGFDALASMTTIAFGVLGGIGYIAGAVAGGGFNPASLPTAVLSEVFGAFDVQSFLNTVLPLVGGLALLVQIIAQPGGMVDAIVHGSARKQRKQHEARARLRQDAEARGEVWQAPMPRPSIIARLLGVGRAAQLRDARRAEAQIAKARQATRVFRGTALTVQSATVQYGAVKAVDDLTFTVAPGEVLSIIGPNGAGKTSVMDAVTGFARMNGRILLGDRDISSWPTYKRSRAGLVRSFQTLELLEDMTVLDNLRAAGDAQDALSYFLDLVRPDRGGITAATVAAIDVFGLGPALGSIPADLPFGDRRLVAIARAVAAEPSVLLLDEPAAGLSQEERRRVGDLITVMAHEWNIAVVLIEHDVELVRRVSDRVIALDFGSKICEGTAEEVIADARVVSAYLGTDDAEDEHEVEHEDVAEVAR